MQVLTKMTNQILKEMRDQESFTSIGKIIFNRTEDGHEFELRTITENFTKTNQANVL